jgi:PEP-CTERM motif
VIIMTAFKFLVSTAIGLAFAASPGFAATFVVKAFDHSVNGGGGTPLSTGIALTTGQALTVSSSTNDLWSAGALPRFSDANGLTGVRLANALDDSGQPVGTQIGANFGLPSFNGFTAPFGALVGRIGGVYQLVGANFSGPAWNTGTLELFYWDSNKGDNFGEISFNISAAPEPASWALMIAGFGLAGAAIRRRTRVQVTYA